MHSDIKFNYPLRHQKLISFTRRSPRKATKTIIHPQNKKSNKILSHKKILTQSPRMLNEIQMTVAIKSKAYDCLFHLHVVFSHKVSL